MRTSATSPGLVTEVGATAPARQWSFAGRSVHRDGPGWRPAAVPAGFDLAVVMDVDATDAQIADVRAALAHDGHVKRVQTVTRDAALARSAPPNANNPSLLASVTSAMMPVIVRRRQRSDRWITPLGSTSAGGVDTVVTLESQAPLVADQVVVLNPGSRPVRVGRGDRRRLDAVGAGDDERRGRRRVRR